jgi:hypothetical protein
MDSVFEPKHMQDNDFKDAGHVCSGVQNRDWHLRKKPNAEEAGRHF